MHFLIVMVLHALIYGMIFHLLRHLTGPELIGLGAGAIVVLLIMRFRRAGRRSYPGNRW
jgi:hypothetical protein